MENRNSFLLSIPAVTRHLLIINFICWLADAVLTSRGISLVNLFGLYYIGSNHFHLWQPLTYMFLHGGFSHMFFNMFALFMFATPLERQWGNRRFLTYYLITGVGAAIVQELVWFLMYGSMPMPAVTIGASGAVFGILFAFGWLFPDTRLFVFPIPIPIRARVFVIVYAVLELLLGVSNAVGASIRDNVAHFAHLGGFIFGWLLILWWRRNNNNFASTSSDFSFTQWWQKIKAKLNRREKEDNPYKNYHYQSPISENKQENAEDNSKEQEISRILDKIRQSGYDSLTDDEKTTIFKR